MDIKGIARTFRRALLRYIQENVEQLAEEITGFDDSARVVGSEESGEWAVIVVEVRYTVHPHLRERYPRTWRWDGSMSELICELDKAGN